MFTHSLIIIIYYYLGGVCPVSPPVSPSPPVPGSVPVTGSVPDPGLVNWTVTVPLLLWHDCVLAVLFPNAKAISIMINSIIVKKFVRF